MTAAEFEAKCLAVLDDVAAGQREVIVTKRGCPVAPRRGPDGGLPGR